MRIETDESGDPCKVFVEVGDTIELYDWRGLSTGLTHDIADVDAITIWPGRDVEVAMWRVVARDGRSAIGSFDVAVRVRRRDSMTVDPMMHLPRRA